MCVRLYIECTRQMSSVFNILMLFRHLWFLLVRMKTNIRIGVVYLSLIPVPNTKGVSIQIPNGEEFRTPLKHLRKTVTCKPCWCRTLLYHKWVHRGKMSMLFTEYWSVCLSCVWIYLLHILMCAQARRSSVQFRWDSRKVLDPFSSGNQTTNTFYNPCSIGMSFLSLLNGNVLPLLALWGYPFLLCSTGMSFPSLFHGNVLSFLVPWECARRTPALFDLLLSSGGL